MDELPSGTWDVEYYWHYTVVITETAYSMVLSEDAYEKLMDSRINSYVETSDSPTHLLLYEFQKEERQYIDNSEWYKEKLDYVDNTLHYPEAQQQYYFGAIMQVNTGNDVCYTGLIGNDSSHEIIEFSAEMPKDYKIQKPSSQNSPSWLGLVELIILAAIVLMVIRGMTILDRKIDERAGRKKSKAQKIGKYKRNGKCADGL